MCRVWTSILFLTQTLGWEVAILAADSRSAGAEGPGYEYREEHDRNGIGKFYFGREIARVMGHEAAEWLERPERQQEERPDLLMEELGVRPGEVVADIGAGSGYYSWRAAQRVGSSGLVYAVDIQQEMLDLLAGRMAEQKVTNVKGILGTITDPKLPVASVDVVFLVDVYHEFDHPYEMMRAICAALKPGGRVVFVEYRSEDPEVPIKVVHKMSEEQVRKEMSVHPLTWVATSRALPWQHVIHFRKAAGTVENRGKIVTPAGPIPSREKTKHEESVPAPAPQ